MDEDLIEIPLIDSWARIRELETELTEATTLQAQAEADLEQALKQVGRLRLACRAALDDLQCGDVRPLTLSLLKEVLS